MADILTATLGSPIPTEEEIEAARNCIDDTSFKMLEKLLKLGSPDIQFRGAILEAIVIYRRSPDPASLDRKNLKALREYFSNVLQHLHDLEKLLPPKGEHDSLQSNFLLRVILEQAFEGRDYLTFQTALNNFVKATKAANAKLTTQRVPPNLRLEAVKWLVRLLAEIFQERTGKDPRDHIQSNYTKSKYKGTFFHLANEILKRVGHRRENATQGRMIVKVLRPKVPRPV
jgi:hypothetical protein